MLVWWCPIFAFGFILINVHPSKTSINWKLSNKRQLQRVVDISCSLCHSKSIYWSRSTNTISNWHNPYQIIPIDLMFVIYHGMQYMKIWFRYKCHFLFGCIPMLNIYLNYEIFSLSFFKKFCCSTINHYFWICASSPVFDPDITHNLTIEM